MFELLLFSSISGNGINGTDFKFYLERGIFDNLFNLVIEVTLHSFRIYLLILHNFIDYFRFLLDTIDIDSIIEF